MTVLAVVIGGCKGGCGKAGAAATHPTDAECVALADHLVSVLMDEARSKKPELNSLGPSQQQMLDLATRQAAQKIQTKCMDPSFDRARYDCVMAAKGADDLHTCEPKRAP